MEPSLADRVKVYLFRHGETDWNFQKRWQGHSDIPLNATGLQQAARLAEELKSFGIQHIFSSDLLRAKQTAEIAAGVHRLKITLDSRLRETNLGKAEGLTNDEVVQRFGEDTWERWARFEEQDPAASFPGGESKPAVLKRVLESLTDHLSSTRYQTVAFSTHGGALRRLIHWLRPELREPVMVPNCMTFHIHFQKDSQQLIWISDHPPTVASKTGPF